MKNGKLNLSDIKFLKFLENEIITQGRNNITDKKGAVAKKKVPQLKSNFVFSKFNLRRTS